VKYAIYRPASGILVTSGVLTFQLWAAGVVWPVMPLMLGDEQRPAALPVRGSSENTESGPTGRNLIQASGTLNEICLFGELKLSFKPPALILPGKSTTLIYVMVPMKMAVTNGSTSAGMPAINSEPRSAAHYDRPPVSLNIPNPIAHPGNDTGMEPVVLAKIMLQTNSGTPISACAQLPSPDGSFKTPNFCQSGGLPLSN
jgi:hypothetical protein